ncbi:hypothetical protein ACHAQA_001986 [Verticillium albo-atrum]
MPVLKGLSVAEKIKRGVIFTHIPAKISKHKVTTMKVSPAKVIKTPSASSQQRRQATDLKKRAKTMSRTNQTTRSPKATLLQMGTPTKANRRSARYLPTPPPSTKRSPSITKEVIYVRTDTPPPPSTVDFNTKLRAAVGLPPLPQPDIELYLRSLPGFDPDAVASFILTPGQELAVRRAFGFPTSPLVLSHDTREEAVAAAEVRLHDYLVDLFRAAVACKKYFPSVDDEDDEDDEGDGVSKEDRLCDFIAAVGAAVDDARREDRTWVVGYGPSGLGGDARMALFKWVFGSYLAADDACVSTTLACAVAKWEDVWWIKTGRL